MKRAWRIVIVIVLLAILLGAVCIGVGLMTGADYSRIYQTLDSSYHIDMWLQYYQQVLEQYEAALQSVA